MPANLSSKSCLSFALALGNKSIPAVLHVLMQFIAFCIAHPRSIGAKSRNKTSHSIRYAIHGSGTPFALLFAAITPSFIEGTAMRNEEASTLRYAIENLINAKLCDALHHPDGLARLLGHRSSGVASSDVRAAEQALEGALKRCIASSSLQPASKPAKPGDRAHRDAAHAGTN